MSRGSQLPMAPAPGKSDYCGLYRHLHSYTYMHTFAQLKTIKLKERKIPIVVLKRKKKFELPWRGGIRVEKKFKLTSRALRSCRAPTTVPGCQRESQRSEEKSGAN